LAERAAPRNRSLLGEARGSMQGAYVLSRERGGRPHILLLASGSEVQLVLQAQAKLYERGIDARVSACPAGSCS
ncbi:transketolase, partial [Acidithiobacillus sp. GGI-221]